MVQKETGNAAGKKHKTLKKSSGTYLEFEPAWGGEKLNGNISLWRKYIGDNYYKYHEQNFTEGKFCRVGRYWEVSGGYGPEKKHLLQLEKYYENNALQKTLHYDHELPYLTIFWDKGACTEFEFTGSEDTGFSNKMWSRDAKLSIFIDFQKLKTLSVNYCNDRQLMLEPDKEYTDIEQLVIEHCTRVTDISKIVKHFPGLKVLNIKNSHIRFVPGEIALLENLEELYISATALPREIGELKNLKKLHLEGIIELPDAFGNLENLEELKISSAYFEKIPDSIGNLKNLKKLYLRSVWYLPEAIKNCESLNEINISNINCNTSLVLLPEGLGELKNLTSLNIKDNFVCQLPDSIGNLTALETLDIGGNVLSRLPESIGNLENLKTLRAENNNLTKFRIKNENRLHKLRLINIAKNQIKEFPDVNSVPGLMSLGLWENQITQLPDLDKPSALEVLNLNKNKITEIPNYIVKFEKLTDLYIDGNPIEKIAPELYETKIRAIRKALLPFKKKLQVAGQQKMHILSLKSAVDSAKYIKADDPRREIITKLAELVPDLNRTPFIQGENRPDWRLLVPLQKGRLSISDLLLGLGLLQKINQDEFIAGWSESEDLELTEQEIDTRENCVKNLLKTVKVKFTEILFFKYASFDPHVDDSIDSLFILAGKTLQDEWYGMAPRFINSTEGSFRTPPAQTTAPSDAVIAIQESVRPILKNFEPISVQHYNDEYTTMSEASGSALTEMLEKLFIKVNLMEKTAFDGFKYPDDEKFDLMLKPIDEYFGKNVPDSFIFQLGNVTLFHIFIFGETAHGDSICIHKQATWT